MEGAALGVILRLESCTAYAVRDAFRSSPSEFWSGSAGAIYPLIQRLWRRGFLSSRADRPDGRRRKMLSVTDAGEAVFMAWVLDAELAAGLGFDPLRTRLHFIDLMPAGKREQFLADARRYMSQGPGAEPGPPHVEALHGTWARLRDEALATFSRHWRARDARHQAKQGSSRPIHRPGSSSSRVTVRSR